MWNMSVRLVLIAVLLYFESTEMKTLYSFNSEDMETAPEMDDISVRHTGPSGIPVSLWPLFHYGSKKSVNVHTLHGYKLVMLPGGAIKIIPREINSQ